MKFSFFTATQWQEVCVLNSISIFLIKKKQKPNFRGIQRRHAKTHYHRGRPMNCKPDDPRERMEMGYVVGHNDGRELKRLSAAAPQTIREREWRVEQFHEKYMNC